MSNAEICKKIIGRTWVKYQNKVNKQNPRQKKFQVNFLVLLNNCKPNQESEIFWESFKVA